MRNQSIEEFYSKPFYFSYSSLSKLLQAPKIFFRHYILNERDEKPESYLLEGKIIHCLLLDDGSFDEKYIISPVNLPSENTKQIVDKVYEYHCSLDTTFSTDDLNTYQNKILQILAEINLHQSLKTDAQRIEKIINEQSKSYWEFLIISGNKTIIDSDTLRKCGEAVQILKANSQVCELLGLLKTEMEDINVYNEFYIETLTDKPFGLKGIIDNIKVDYEKKIIYVNDLKTTSKSIVDFPETINFYNYWLQAVMYYRLVHAYFADIIDEDWQVLFHFVVIDKYQQVYCFPVSQITMEEWLIKAEDKLKEAEWHYLERDYQLPHAFAKNMVIL